MLVLSLCAGAVRTARAQDHEPALSEGEVEKLRETAADAPDRLLVFVAFLNRRSDLIDQQTAGKRQPGREQDLHTLMEEFTSILDDLEDNLDDYRKRHWDVRKALPKLIAATERWGTSLKTPPDREEYSVSRKLALESLHDVHESAVQMVEEQRAWFKEHPPVREAERPRLQ